MAAGILGGWRFLGGIPGGLSGMFAGLGFSLVLLYVREGCRSRWSAVLIGISAVGAEVFGAWTSYNLMMHFLEWYLQQLASATSAGEGSAAVATLWALGLYVAGPAALAIPGAMCTGVLPFFYARGLRVEPLPFW